METNTQLGKCSFSVLASLLIADRCAYIPAFTPLYGIITIRADLAKGLGVKIQFDKNGFEEPRAESLTKAQLNMPEQSTAPYVLSSYYVDRSTYQSQPRCKGILGQFPHSNEPLVMIKITSLSGCYFRISRYIT